MEKDNKPAGVKWMRTVSVGKPELNIPHVFHLNDSSHKQQTLKTWFTTVTKHSLLPALRSSLLYKCSFLCSTTCCILGLLEKSSHKLILDLAISLNYNYPVSKFPTTQTVFDNETMAWSVHRDGKPARTNFWTLPPSITSHRFIQSHQI